MPTKTKVFISSTIHDFKDLRLALRHYLKSLGYEPVLSECNDFNGEIDKNSYDACLDSIKSCQYFILLIGSRVGGYYDEKNKIPITRQEYRIAYKQLLESQLKILPFVRRSVWDIREDRKALSEYLKKEWQKTKELSDQDISTIANHSGRFVNNAENIFSFIDEVVKHEEMKVAQIGNKLRPLSNWIYQFETFSEIVDALKVQLNIFTTIGELTALCNLRREIISNIQFLIEKRESDLFLGFYWLSFLKDFDINYNFETTEIQYNFMTRLKCYVTFIGTTKNISIRYAHEIINSGQVHYLDNQSGYVCLTKFGEAILQLIEQIEKFKGMEKTIFNYQQQLLKCGSKTPIDKQQKVPIGNDLLYTFKYAHDRHQDILNLSKAIVNAIDGDESFLENLKLNPISPSKEEEKRLNQEKLSIDEIEKWIKTNNCV